MNTRRRLSVAAGAKASATLAVASLGGDALASNTAARAAGTRGGIAGNLDEQQHECPLDQGNTLVQVMTITPGRT